MTRLAAAFQTQAAACKELGSPFMGQLCMLLSERLAPTSPLTQRLFNWPGDVGPYVDSVPLRLCAALHALRLQGDAGLASVYPPHAADEDALWAAVAEALDTKAAFIDAFINTPPQTNEVRRAAVLIAGTHVIADRFPLPFRLSELGASGGLNLNFDRFALLVEGERWGPEDAVLTLEPGWRGPVPPRADPIITERRGVDLNPVTDALRLRAYLWPDQPERLALTDAALTLPAAPVDQGDAIEWLEPRLTHIPGEAHLIYNTVAWQYFPAEAQARGKAMIEKAGALATRQHPLAWLQLETDGGGRGAELTLRLWPGDEQFDLARVDFHGRWVGWRG